MSDYISIHTGATIDNAISSVINGRAGIQGIISNGTELEPDQNNKILLNVPDISQSTGNSTTATMSQNAITNQLREKANANLLNNYYQKTESYSKTEIDNIISELPKFDIKVVLALPTENISESTIYLVPTSQEEGGLYQEYVYINNRWELLGGQSVDLSDYYNRQTIDRFLDSKLDVGEVTQSVGYNSTKVMSQKAVTDELNDKFDKTSIDNYYNKAETNSLLNDRININKIVQSAGEDTTSVMSQNAITDLLNTKVDKSSIVQTTGNSTTSVMSQDSVTDAIDGKIDKTSIVQTTGNSTTSVMSQDSITNSLDAKFDKSSIVQTSGNSTTSVMSQDAVTMQLNSKADSGSLSTVATSGSYNDLSNKPTKLSDFTNDGVFITNATNNLTNYYNKTGTDSLLSNKVDKITGKGLSTEDYTTAEKTKLANIATEANKTVVVQTTGNSTTSVMSQDAVTNQLGNKANVSALNDYYNKSSVNSLLSGKMDNIGFNRGVWTPNFGYYNPNNGTATSIPATFDDRGGQYTIIGDLCFINFYLYGKLTSTPSYYVAVTNLPYNAASGVKMQTLSIGTFALTDKASIIWSPTPGIAARMEENTNYVLFCQENGFKTISWPNDTTNYFYIEASGSYKINYN